MPRKVTVAGAKAEGVRGAWVRCRAQGCRNFAYLTWEAMRLTPADRIDDVQWQHRIRCSVCGGREVSFRPCWIEPFP